MKTQNYQKRLENSPDPPDGPLFVAVGSLPGHPESGGADLSDPPVGGLFLGEAERRHPHRGGRHRPFQQDRAGGCAPRGAGWGDPGCCLKNHGPCRLPQPPQEACGHRPLHHRPLRLLHPPRQPGALQFCLSHRFPPERYHPSERMEFHLPEFQAPELRISL